MLIPEQQEVAWDFVKSEILLALVVQWKVNKTPIVMAKIVNNSDKNGKRLKNVVFRHFPLACATI